MLKRALTAGAAVLAAAACAETTTDPAGPIQAAVVAKVSLCHWDATTGQFGLIMVPTGGKPYQKHLAHGDGEPGGPVPGRAGYVFDNACVPVLAERVFAIAYTDVNPNDGLGFKDGIDVLIAKLVDANHDGVVSVGDQVIMGRYPMDLDATAFGNFGVTTHTVAGLLNVTSTLIVVQVGTGLIGFQKDGSEQYGEAAAGVSTLGISDNLSFTDLVRTTQDANPSQPDATVSITRAEDPFVPVVDDAFIDVEINVP